MSRLGGAGGGDLIRRHGFNGKGAGGFLAARSAFLGAALGGAGVAGERCCLVCWGPIPDGDAVYRCARCSVPVCRSCGEAFLRRGDRSGFGPVDWVRSRLEVLCEDCELEMVLEGQ